MRSRMKTGYWSETTSMSSKHSTMDRNTERFQPLRCSQPLRETENNMHMQIKSLWVSLKYIYISQTLYYYTCTYYYNLKSCGKVFVLFNVIYSQMFEYELANKEEEEKFCTKLAGNWSENSCSTLYDLFSIYTALPLCQSY